MTLSNTNPTHYLSSMPFYTLFILSTFSNEFGVDRKVCVNLESAYRTGEKFLGCENVYGYVITKHEQDSWSVITETVYGVDYTIGEHNGVVFIEEGKAQIVMV
jgi:hypothetical protein